MTVLSLRSNGHSRRNVRNVELSAPRRLFPANSITTKFDLHFQNLFQISSDTSFFQVVASIDSLIIHTCWCSRDEPVNGGSSQKEANSRLEFHFRIFQYKEQSLQSVALGGMVTVTLSWWIAILFALRIDALENRNTHKAML